MIIDQYPKVNRSYK